MPSTNVPTPPRAHRDGTERRAPDAGPPQTATRSYETAVSSGFYLRDRGGLEGKHDNIRRCWEDQITRYALHQFVRPLVQRTRRQLSRIRALDLGAGSGEGYEILTSLRTGGDTLVSREIDVLPPESIGFYMGLDLSPAMVNQAEMSYENEPKVGFQVADLAQGLGPALKHAPYDIYLSSYGSLSHLNDDELARLIADICDHCNGRCVFVADLLGRFSFEWPCYWGQDRSSPKELMQPYSMSYLYPPDAVGDIEVEEFPMRYWGGEEFDAFVARVVASKGGRITKRQLHDRSLLVGRHIDTAQYNPHVRPIRRAVNRLHETTRRTDLRSLIFDYAPHPRFDRLNAFFERFQMAWNAVVYDAIDALDHWDDSRWLRRPAPDEYPSIVRDAIQTFRTAVRHVQWFRMGDARASVVEPQLGYILRNLEMDLQEGLGAGHGLLAIYEFETDASPDAATEQAT